MKNKINRKLNIKKNKKLGLPSPSFNKKTGAGFTLVEVLIGLVSISALLLAVTAFFYSILTLRDQALAATITAEQSETIFSLVGNAIRQAQSIEVLNGGQRLELTGLKECWTFEYNSTDLQLNFARTNTDPCTPPVSATNPLSSSQVDIDSAIFSIIDPDDSSRSVELDIQVTTTRPLFTKRQRFDRVFVNLVDE